MKESNSGFSQEGWNDIRSTMAMSIPASLAMSALECRGFRA